MIWNYESDLPIQLDTWSIEFVMKASQSVKAAFLYCLETFSLSWMVKKSAKNYFLGALFK